MEDRIVRIICRLTLPFIQLYGIYIIIYGHLSPGGGFAGGAIIGASMVLFALSFNIGAGSKKLPETTSGLMESGGAILFAVVGLVAVILGGNFLSNQHAGFGLGTYGTIFSGGIIPLLSIAIGIKITSTIVTLFYDLIGGEKTEDGTS